MSLPRLIRFYLCALACLWGTALFAAEGDELYRGEVVVASRDDAAERTRAFTRGLEDVLLKLSGRADTLRNPAIRRQIQNTQPLVEGWTYRTRTVDGAEQIYLDITYFQPEIQRLLDSAGIPLWPANRPQTLVWLVRRDELGEPELADAALEPAVYQHLQEEAARRALPLRLPLLDLQDRLSLNAEQVWTMDAQALRAASQRYAGDSILALSLFRTLTGETYAKATYLFGERVLELENFEESETEFLDAAIALAAEELAGIFAVRMAPLVNDDGGGAFAIFEVQGVRGMADYAALLKYLNDLTVVNSVQVLQAEGDKLLLQVRNGGQLRQLMETLAFERRLVQQGEPLRTGQEIAVQYLWQGAP
ncbi:MAG: DUF2066 domain-containing protein [Pseudomonadales bacterium]|nr:DUF2066 domain-containing protein [Pseudomonadales bacterium]